MFIWCLHRTGNFKNNKKKKELEIRFLPVLLCHWGMNRAQREYFILQLHLSYHQINSWQHCETKTLIWSYVSPYSPTSILLYFHLKWKMETLRTEWKVNLQWPFCAGYLCFSWFLLLGMLYSAALASSFLFYFSSLFLVIDSLLL